MDFRLHPLQSAAVLAALPKGHAAIAFVDVGAGFVDRAAVLTKTSTKISTKRTKKHWTTEEEMEGPTSS